MKTTTAPHEMNLLREFKHLYVVFGFSCKTCVCNHFCRTRYKNNKSV